MSTPNLVLRNPVWSMIQELAACLCATVESSDLPPLCECGIYPGDTTPYDYVGGACDGADGIGWVRLGSAFPSRNFPIPAIDLSCGTALAFTAEVGIIRTLPGDPSQQDWEPPTAAWMAKAAEQQMKEMVVMQYAITCCFGTNKDNVMGTYTPVGPEGMAVGGTWTVTIAADDADDD